MGNAAFSSSRHRPDGSVASQNGVSGSPGAVHHSTNRNWSSMVLLSTAGIQLQLTVGCPIVSVLVGWLNVEMIDNLLLVTLACNTTEGELEMLSRACPGQECPPDRLALDVFRRYPKEVSL